MAPRTSKRALSEDSSDLSPPPEELEVPIAPAAATNGGAGSKKRKRTVAQVKVETEVGAVAAAAPDEPSSTTPKRTRKRKAVEYKEEEDNGNEAGVEAATEATPKKRKKTTKNTKVVEVEENGQVKSEEKITAEHKSPRKRKTKEEKEAEAMPLAARTIGPKMLIGAHVSSAGGVHNAVTNAVHIGANAFALFLKSQRKWTNPPLDPSHSDTFHAHCTTHAYSGKHVVPHGSYLVNLAHTNPARTTQAYDVFLDDLHRCERLGIALYNFHPGNSVGNDRASAVAHLARNLNRAHAATSSVVTLLENMAAGANVIGSTFEDLRDVIALVDDKSRVGVCLDTCHAFAAGYDLRTPEALGATLEHFDQTVGMRYLRAVHLNDSKAPFRSHRDLHANVGTGFLELRAFHAIVNDGRFKGLPMVLETPIEVRDEDGVLIKDEKAKVVEDKAIWAAEIKLLERLVGMDVEGDEFVGLSLALQRKGKGERERVAEQVEKREEKAKAKGEKSKKGKKKNKAAAVESDESSLSDLEEG